jgi:hypothetical protein
MPTVVGVGAATSATGNITPAYPGGYTAIANDIAITFIETESETVTVPTNWAVLSTVPVSSGTVTRLTAVWRRLTASEAAPTYSFTTNHKVGRMIVVSGCRTSGNPWNQVTATTELLSDQSVSIPGVTTTAADCLVLAAFGTGQDVANTTALTWTNASLTSVTHRMANWVTTALGGGFAMCTGQKAVAGATGSTTTTASVASNFKTLMTIALEGEPAAPPVPIPYLTMGRTRT